MSDDLLALFRKTGALLDGHFVLRSGLHSRQFFQCALLLQYTDIAADVCGRLADKLRHDRVRRGHFACARWHRRRAGGRARARETSHFCRERCGRAWSCDAAFEIGPNERFIVAEDVVTRGGRVQETVDIVRSHGGVVAAVGVIVDRSGGNRPDFGVRSSASWR